MLYRLSGILSSHLNQKSFIIHALCNQLLPQFLKEKTEILHIYFRHIVDISEEVKCSEMDFDKITALFNCVIFEGLKFPINYGSTTCKAFFPSSQCSRMSIFYRKQTKTVHINYRPNENNHKEVSCAKPVTDKIWFKKKELYLYINPSTVVDTHTKLLLQQTSY